MGTLNGMLYKKGSGLISPFEIRENKITRLRPDVDALKAGMGGMISEHFILGANGLTVNARHFIATGRRENFDLSGKQIFEKEQPFRKWKNLQCLILDGEFEVGNSNIDSYLLEASFNPKMS